MARVEKRLRKHLARGGEAALWRLIAEEILTKTPDPREEIARVKAELAALEAATREALAYLGRFREALEEGSLEQRKEFLRGFVAEIGIDPDTARGTIVFYELPAGSLMMVPGARVELLETLRCRRLDDFSLPEESWRVAA